LRSTDDRRIKLMVEMRTRIDFNVAGPASVEPAVPSFPTLAGTSAKTPWPHLSPECRRTEIPHLFEHLIIELQSQAQPAEVLRGETEWNWTIDPRGRFHVHVDYENELLAIGAIRWRSGLSTPWISATSIISMWTAR
jgi:hypothetical protein